MLDFLDLYPEIEHVWYDHACLPPSDDADADADAVGRMRRCACLPFLCGSCLLLVDGGYCARFWTQYEAWLSLQKASAAGIVDARTRERCHVRLLHEEPEFMATLLIEMWKLKPAGQAGVVLRSPLVPAARAADKEEQLGELARLDEWLRREGPRQLGALMADGMAATDARLAGQLV